MVGARTVAPGVHPIRQNTSFILAKACRAHRAYVGELLAEHGLHVGQEMVLVELWQGDGLRCGAQGRPGGRQEPARLPHRAGSGPRRARLALLGAGRTDRASRHEHQ